RIQFRFSILAELGRVEHFRRTTCGFRLDKNTFQKSSLVPRNSYSYSSLATLACSLVEPSDLETIAADLHVTPPAAVALALIKKQPAATGGRALTNQGQFVGGD